jgi:hypothetical protein
MMFERIENYPYLKTVHDNLGVINGEFRAFLSANHISLDDNDMGDHYSGWWSRDNGLSREQVGYNIKTSGAYSSISIFKKGYPIKTFDANKCFGKSIQIINEIPNVHYAGFFTMTPGTSLDTHTHTRRHLIYHLLLDDLRDGECHLTCQNESKYISNKGDEVLFDYSLPHGSTNRSSSNRSDFVVDFKPW